MEPQPQKNQSQPPVASAYQPTIELNKGGYVYERFGLKIHKMLACSNNQQVRNNLIWSEKQRQIIYTSANIIVIENLNAERT